MAGERTGCPCSGGPLLGQPHAPGPRGCSSTHCWEAQKWLALVGVGLVTPRYKNGKIHRVCERWQSALWAVLVATRRDRPNVSSAEIHFWIEVSLSSPGDRW